MDNVGYTTLTRQSGLMREMAMIANNVANLATTGYRAQGLLFSEHVERIDGGPALSMARGHARLLSNAPGPLQPTGGRFDMAIEGEGYFLVETPDGEALTRAGAFSINPVGELVTPDGLRLLDGGAAPILVPEDASTIGIARDGTLSADGEPFGQVGLWLPERMADTRRDAGSLLVLEAPPVPVPPETATIVQGHLEGSNVDPMAEIARMIEVQRAYELGQSFLDREDERLKVVLDTV